eukprot:scaffold176478_cov27-Tisochrysis_lutea.AAC.2
MPSINGGGRDVPAAAGVSIAVAPTSAGPNPEASRSHSRAIETVLSSASAGGRRPTTTTAAGGGSSGDGGTVMPRDMTSITPLASVRPASA